MANNLFANQKHGVIAKAATSISAAGLDATNTKRIYAVGDVFRSYVPGRSINAFTQLEADKPYWIEPLTNMDKESYFMPPLTGGTPPPATDYITGYTAIAYTGVSGMAETSGVWAGGAGSGYGGNAVFVPTESGRIVHKYAADTNLVAFGWNGNNAQGNNFADLSVSAYVDGSTLQAWEGGSQVNANVATLSAGTYIGILREYTTGYAYKLQTSPDGITWTTVYAFSWTGGANNWAPAVYHLSASGKHYYPQFIKL